MIEQRVYEVSVDFEGDCTPAHEHELTVLINDAVLLLKKTFSVVAIKRVGPLQANDAGIYALIHYQFNSEKVKRDRKGGAVFGMPAIGFQPKRGGMNNGD